MTGVSRNPGDPDPNETTPERAPGEPDGMPAGDWWSGDLPLEVLAVVNAAGDWARTEGAQGACRAMYDGLGRLIAPFTCTLPAGHAGRHAAAAVDRVVAMWPSELSAGAW